MLLLALDTSTRYSSIALCSTDELSGEHTWYSGNNHSVELLEYTQRLLANCQKTWSQLDAVAVSTGPGSFNGVRVGLAMAKTLAFTLGKPLVGVSSLDCIAVQQRHWQGVLCAVQEAGRGEIYAAGYRCEAQDLAEGERQYRLRQLGDYLLGSPQLIVHSLQEQMRHNQALSTEIVPDPVLFCGEIGAATRQALYAALPEQSHFLGNVEAVRRASGLAYLARQRLQASQVDDPLTLEPLYLRRPSITTSTRKRSLLGNGDRQTSGSSTTEREEGALRH